MHITLSDFKNLLHSLKEENIGIKVKTHTGWTNDFLNIIGFIVSTIDQEKKTFGGVVLSNATETEGVMINNIASISSFELKTAYGPFEGNKVYDLHDVTLDAVILE